MIPDDGTLGLDGIDDFGKNIKSFGESMKNYSTEVSGVDYSSFNSSIAGARNLTNFISSLAGIDTSGVKSFKDAVKSLGDVNVGAVVDAFSSASGSLKSVGAGMTSALAEGFKSKTSQIKAVANTLVNQITTGLKTKSGAFKDAGVSLMGNLVNGMNSKAGTVTSASMVVASYAESGVRGYYDNFYRAGEFLVSGLAYGIEYHTYIAVDEATDMAAAVAAAVRAELNINSPSKVFAEIGSSIPEGFALGIDKYGYYVKSSISNMASGAIDNTKSVLSRIADTINSDVDSQPMIRPVLDLTNVQSGANAINSMLSLQPSMGTLASIGGVNAMMNRRSQNGAESEVVAAINRLNKSLGNVGNTTYNVNGVTYDDGSAIANTVEVLARAVLKGRRV
jgi:hypothetical protein